MRVIYSILAGISLKEARGQRSAGSVLTFIHFPKNQKRGVSSNIHTFSKKPELA